MGRVWLWPVMLIQTVAGLSVDPFVYWSMEEREGTTLLPDFGNKTEFSVDLATFGTKKHFKPGVIGSALIVESRKIRLIEDIWKSDCIRNPSKCEDGLTVSFWLNVMEQGPRPSQIIRSSDEDGRRPGIYIGEDKANSTALLFFVRTEEGKRYQASAPWSVVQKKWSQVALYWNATLGVKIFINGSQLQNDEYLAPPTVQDVAPSYPTKVDLVAGDILGPTFLLDDLWIFYHALTDVDIFSLYELGVLEPPAIKKGNSQPPGTSAASVPNTTVEYSILVTSRPSYKPTVASTSLKFPSTEPQPPKDENQSTAFNTITTSRTSDVVATQDTERAETTESHVQKNKPDLVTKREVKPVPPYNGWFYSQPWYHILLGVTFVVMFAFSTWLCVVHCCLPSIKGEPVKVTADDAQAMGLEPLVQG